MAKRSTYNPVAILCSSGTAAVNFAPAVVEAAHSHVPLIVLTADRPQELRDLGANQSIDQVRLYGTAVKWFVEMPLPEANDAVLRYARMAAGRAYATARRGLPGPVHLNFPFREPLIPSFLQPPVLRGDNESFWNAARLREAPLIEPDRSALARAEEDSSAPSAQRDDIDPEHLLVKARRAVIVAGEGSYAYSRPLIEYAANFGFPIFADPLSQGRFDHKATNVILGAYDSFLRVSALVDRMQPDLIIRLGRPPTSKALATYLQSHKHMPQLLVTEMGEWLDPDLTTHAISTNEIEDLVDGLVPDIQRQPLDADWLGTWRAAEAAARCAIDEVLGNDGLISEPAVIIDLANVAPTAHAVFAGNSMPVRDLDSFWPVRERPNFFHANRGASGIDGVISTFLGFTARENYGSDVLIIGDLSFYHDMNGLLAAQRFGLKATIVLVNNDGGGIFSFLPQNEDQQHFEALFGTPHGLDFEPVAKLYGLGWTRVNTRADYRAALEASFDSPGVQVIEVKTDRVENLKLHQRIWDEVEKAVSPLAQQIPSPN
jgi:2-succinyl-5-enolpyruvyl-6-hydroxy-3-cyclohexene-1-carboxylate synthase